MNIRTYIETLPEPDRSIRLEFLKPRSHFLNSLPEPVKSQAYANLYKKADLEEEVESMAEALGGGFEEDDLDNTPQGFQYWYKIITDADEDYQRKLPRPEWLDKV